MSNGAFIFFGEQNLKKYQDESTKVSKVSVSLIADSPVFLWKVFVHVGWLTKGFPLFFKSTSFGSLIGIIPLQLMAYYCSIHKGINPDKPKNLAKVVTVE